MAKISLKNISISQTSLLLLRVEPQSSSRFDPQSTSTVDSWRNFYIFISLFGVFSMCIPPAYSLGKLCMFLTKQKCFEIH